MSNELTQKTTNRRRINEIAMKIITTKELLNKKDKSTEVMREKEDSNKKTQEEENQSSMAKDADPSITLGF